MLRSGNKIMLFSRHGNSRRQRAEVGVLWVLLVLTSLCLMVLSKLDHSYIRWARGIVSETAAPMLRRAQDAMAPLKWAAHQGTSYVEMVKHYDALKLENRELQHWKLHAKELERQLADLSALARTVKSNQTTSLTARVIATAPGNFSGNVLIAAGRRQQVLAGHAVVDAGGLAGRVVDAYENTARVMLLTDLQSRIPVHVGDNRARALMLGGSGALPRLGFLAEGEAIKAGDSVETSGVGGLLPRGLRIGEVVEVEGNLAVRLAADLEHLDYVAVLLHPSPELELSDGAGARAVGRRAQVQPGGGREATP